MSKNTDETGKITDSDEDKNIPSLLATPCNKREN
jgi:hypothetical protein